MAFFHGVKGSEVPTSIVPAVATTAGLPVVFGTAPVHLIDDPYKNVNKPVICYDRNEAVSNLYFFAYIVQSLVVQSNRMKPVGSYLGIQKTIHDQFFE